MIRDRIRELRRVRADSLRPHPRNWRLHPPEQRAALERLLHSIGYAGALIARQCADGALELIDGHLRAETTPDALVPVLVVDLDEQESALLLATHDPLAAMAEVDAVALGELADAVETQSLEAAAMLDELMARHAAPSDAPSPKPPTLDELYQVVVECRDEAEQRALYERLRGEGRRVRLQML